MCEKDDRGFVTSVRADELCVPDADSGNWGFTDPDWDEFFRVIRGNGPCNAHRLGLRRFSYEQGMSARNAIAKGRTTTPPAA